MAVPQPSCREDFEIAIICALPLEYNAVSLVFDKFWDEDGDKYGRATGDFHSYTTGCIGKYNVVLALLSQMGKANAASAAANIRLSYNCLRLALLVGICGGVPRTGNSEDDEILLGDVIISKTVVQYDFGRQYPDKFVRKNTVEDNPSKPNKDVCNLLVTFETDRGRDQLQERTARFLKQLQANAARKNRRKYNYPGTAEDRLFESGYRHKHQVSPTCVCRDCNGDSDPVCNKAPNLSCDDLGCEDKYLVPRERIEMKRRLEQDRSDAAQEPAIHLGPVASGDTVMKSGEDRDRISKKEGIIAFEMEGAGVWEEVPCIVVKGVCDYADCHKNKKWQNFAAATAASASKAILERYIQTDKVQGAVIGDGSHSISTASTVQREQDIFAVIDIIKKILEENDGRSQQHKDVVLFFNLLQLFRISYPSPEIDFDPASIPDRLKGLLRDHYMRLLYIFSLCLRVVFKELLQLFGLHFILFLHVLNHCGSHVPKLLVGAHIVFEDVLGEEISMQYRECRHWRKFSAFLQNRFENRHGQRYVTTGLFQLYDYEGSAIGEKQWHKLVPNSKVTMSIVARRFHPNACGRCFKVEYANKPGTIITCSNCRLKYTTSNLTEAKPEHDATRVTEITDEVEPLKPNITTSSQSPQPQPRSPLIPAKAEKKQGQAQRGIGFVLGYDQELEHFVRVDFQVTGNSEPIRSLMLQLEELILSMFRLFKEQGHRVSPEHLSGVQGFLHHCHVQVRSLLDHSLFTKLDDDAFLLLHKVDVKAYSDVRRQWDQLRYGATTMYRQLQSQGFLELPQGFSDLLHSCGNSLETMNRLLEHTLQRLQRDGYVNIFGDYRNLQDNISNPAAMVASVDGETYTRSQYTVGIICALPKELIAVRALFDCRHDRLKTALGDSNQYAFGQMAQHMVVAACLPAGEYGTNSAAMVASNMARSFPSIRFYLLVGIGGGAPSEKSDIRLGDVVVGWSTGTFGGVLQYDLGKEKEGSPFELTGTLQRPPRVLTAAIGALISEPDLRSGPLGPHLRKIAERLPKYSHPGRELDVLFQTACSACQSQMVSPGGCSHVRQRVPRSTVEPAIHYGPIGSGNHVVKDAAFRDRLARENGVLCFEMEAAGVINTVDCLVIRGICDYCDAHKNDVWQEYAAATAAAYAKLLLGVVASEDSNHTRMV